MRALDCSQAQPQAYKERQKLLTRMQASMKDNFVKRLFMLLPKDSVVAKADADTGSRVAPPDSFESEQPTVLTESPRPREQIQAQDPQVRGSTQAKCQPQVLIGTQVDNNTQVLIDSQAQDHTQVSVGAQVRNKPKAQIDGHAQYHAQKPGI